MMGFDTSELCNQYMMDICKLVIQNNVLFINCKVHEEIENEDKTVYSYL